MTAKAVQFRLTDKQLETIHKAQAKLTSSGLAKISKMGLVSRNDTVAIACEVLSKLLRKDKDLIEGMLNGN
jgi:predicted methyltransferase